MSDTQPATEQNTLTYAEQQAALENYQKWQAEQKQPKHAAPAPEPSSPVHDAAEVTAARKQEEAALSNAKTEEEKIAIVNAFEDKYAAKAPVTTNDVAAARAKAEKLVQDAGVTDMVNELTTQEHRQPNQAARDAANKLLPDTDAVIRDFTEKKSPQPTQESPSPLARTNEAPTCDPRIDALPPHARESIMAIKEALGTSVSGGQHCGHEQKAPPQVAAANGKSGGMEL